MLSRRLIRATSVDLSSPVPGTVLPGATPSNIPSAVPGAVPSAVLSAVGTALDLSTLRVSANTPATTRPFASTLPCRSELTLGDRLPVTSRTAANATKQRKVREAQDAQLVVSEAIQKLASLADEAVDESLASASMPGAIESAGRDG